LKQQQKLDARLDNAAARLAGATPLKFPYPSYFLLLFAFKPARAAPPAFNIYLIFRQNNPVADYRSDS